MAYSSVKQKDLSLLSEIEKALEDVIFGSVEIYVQDSKVTQIAVRKTVKTSISIQGKRTVIKQPTPKVGT